MPIRETINPVNHKKPGEDISEEAVSLALNIWNEMLSEDGKISDESVQGVADWIRKKE
ncbi:hypothetical protein [Jeotgalibacillus terrae]|uniref:Uncharacterized protein n=1 Tax=Jeotgalibacillus terrae TaxID=587735 RepID=A0ABW5ZNL7_9BACL|nr:hypothetical protein [Jeotgalibacillus terrae]MBM7581090.1 hypothetical protein [Jeotgalibacillus terrae]